MEYDNEFMYEVNYYNHGRRRRTVSENEPHNLVPPELFRQTSERTSSTKTRTSQSISPPPRLATASNNGCSPTDEAEESTSRSLKGGSRKIGEWLSGSSQRQRRYTTEEKAEVEPMDTGEPAAAETGEFRRRAGSHGLRDILRIRPRCYSHGEKYTDPESSTVTPARGNSGYGGNGTPLSPGMPGGASSGVSKLKLFLDAFRHRAHSDSLPSSTIQPHG